MNPACLRRPSRAGPSADRGHRGPHPIASYLTVTALTANAAATLLSWGRPATASSNENAGTLASAVVDGNAACRCPGI